MESADIKVTADTNKGKDKVAILSFALGLLCIFVGGVIGLLPIVTIALSIWGINRTKIQGTGRWLAVSGLVLGFIYLIVYSYNYGHLDSFTSSNDKQTNWPNNVQNTPVLRSVNTETSTSGLSEKPSVSVQKDTPSTTPVEAPTPVVQTPKAWLPLTQLSGSGITNTQTFRVTGGKVRITGTLQPSHQYSAYGSFSLECNHCGKYYLGNNLAINTYDGVSKTDSVIYSELPVGDYFVSIYVMAPDAWSLNIEEYR